MRTWKYPLFVGLFVLNAWPAVAGERSVNPPGLTALVLLQNDARVPSDLVARAQLEVTRLYALIGVEIVWIDEVPASGERFRTVSLVRWEPAPGALPASTLGVTYAGSQRPGRLAYVFMERVERAAQKFTASIYNLLAVAIAHELGHMLMPEKAHAKRGVMEESWTDADFRSASAGLLYFSAESGTLIRRGLIEDGNVTARGTPK
jgi:hypothetical protein